MQKIVRINYNKIFYGNHILERLDNWERPPSFFISQFSLNAKSSQFGSEPPLALALALA